MPSSTIIITIFIVILALGFDFINGFHDTANAIATSVATRVLTPRQAIIMSASLNLVGALISVKVATTVGANIIKPEFMPQIAVITMLISSICWNLITWYYGIPSSSSHALIGSLLGAGITYNASFSIVQWGNFMSKIVLWLFLSPIIGFCIGFVFMKILNVILSPFKPKSISKFFCKAQIASAAAMAFNHGSNDAQKSMGIITMALVSGGLISDFHVYTWVKVCCAISMALGTSIGGWRIIKTMGVSMGKLTPVNGFAAETSAAAIIFTATMLDAPVSTTQIISTSIMGVGASKRFSSIRWAVAKNIVWAWVVTIPVCAIFASLITLLIKML